MKIKHLLLTMLLALMVPLAAFAQVERTATVYNGIAKNSHIPFEGWKNGSNQFETWFTISQDELVDAGLVEKPITKMAFYIASSGNYTNYNYYRVTIYNDYQDPVMVVEYGKPEYNAHGELGVMAFHFNWHYIYHGQGDLQVYIWSPMSYQSSFPDHLPQFYGVNLPGVENGYGTHGNGFSPKITFTYQDEATWANTNRPKNLQLTVGDDGTSLGLSWNPVSANDATYQVCCVPRGGNPGNWVTSPNTNFTFTGLTPNTDYDLYVRAKQSAFIYSNPAKAMCTTKRIATLLDQGDLELDFDGGFVPNGITCTGDNDYMLDVMRYTIYWSYFLNYSGTAPVTVNLPPITFSDANNGVIMEFDICNTESLQVQYYSNYNGVSELGTFSASGWTHYSVRFTGQQNAQNACFKMVSSQPFCIDNIVIYKPATTMKPYNIQASNITTNSATITWDDDNTGNDVTWYLRYKKPGETNWSTNQSAISQKAYELTGLDTYSQYEVQVMAYRNSDDHSDYSETFTFATACPATQTTYSQQFTNLSTLPQYWRVVTGEGISYSVSNNRINVRNSDYTDIWGTTAYYMLDAFVILPYFENLATLQLGFNAGRDQGSCDMLTVGVMSDPFDTYTFRTVETLAMNEGTNTYDISLASAAYQHGYIAIKLYKFAMSYMGVWFDDFTVTRAPAPIDLTVSNVTTTSATFSWTTNAPSVELQYREAGGTWTTVTPDANPYTLTGLTISTAYEVQIRANYGTQYSEWASFDNIRTLMQEAVVMNATNTSYYEDFESSDGNWILNNGASSNYWCRSFGAGALEQFMPQTGNKSIYITDGTTTGTSVGQRPAWQYTKMDENQFQNIARPSLVYLTKIFNLSAGQYTFNFDYKVMGNVGEDYLRVFLLPADMELTGTNSSVFPDGYENWYYLDNGSQVAQTPNNNTPSSGFVSFGNGTGINNVVQVKPGSAIEPGNYMMVFAWRNTGTNNGLTNNPVQYPAAIDNVSITWSVLITPPTTLAVDEEADTEVALSWTAPASTLTPTGYQVQYEPLGNNGFDGAPIAETSTNSVTLTGLTPHTNYQVRVRSAYTAGGNTIYSDWTTSVAFTTLYPRPTNLTLVDQTSSWVSMMWDEVELEMEEGQSLGYSYQLTTDSDNWGATHDGVASNGWELTLAPGTYYFRVQTVVRDNNNASFRSPWSEPITFTIAPWTNAVTVFPLTYGFEGSYFDDGITLGGNNFDRFSMKRYSTTGLPAHEGGESTYVLSFGSGYTGEALLVLPPLRPSTNDALVSFWWYHDNSDDEINDGVIVEYSADGSSWSSFGTMTTRYAAETGWVKYSFVVPSPTSSEKVYIRLHFYGANATQYWRCCYLDDLSVNTFKSQQPYIYDVSCDGSTADITLYDYAYDNGWPSSAFQVQYREYSETAGAEEGWITYPYFTNAEPYTIDNQLTVTGLQPTTLYEFRACARVSYSSFDFSWSSYCEPYRQWTSCGTYTITPSYSYTEDFEDEFYLSCWTAEEGWEMQHSGGHNGSSYCAYHPYNSSGNTITYLVSPIIDFSDCDNALLRFWVKTGSSGYFGGVYVRFVENGQTKNHHLYTFPKSISEWTQVTVSLSYYMDKEDVRVVFRHDGRSPEFYIDDIEIFANYPGKVFDHGEVTASGYHSWSNTCFYPTGVPTSSDNVLVCGSAWILSTITASANSVDFASNGTMKIDAGGTANITTLNVGGANSVTVENGGVLNATAITGTSAYVTDRILVKDGGQLTTNQKAFVTVKKNIASYTEIEQQNNVTNGGYCLVSSPLDATYTDPNQVGMITSVTENDNEVLTYDLYAFDFQHEGKEWRNFKNSSFEYLDWGKGYLYANRDGAELTFAGRIHANHALYTINPAYSEGTPFEFNGWNLVGNPFSCNAYITQVSAPEEMSFYRMNPTGTGFIAATGAIAPMEGIFVHATQSGQSFAFSRDENNRCNSKFSLDLKQNDVLVDNAIVTIDEGKTLPKFSFNANTSKVYFPMDDDDYAVVRTQASGILPLNFEPAADGEYTLTLSDTPHSSLLTPNSSLLTPNFQYLHLIDNLTGADIDLLQQPEYTFNARYSDYPSRFKLVFMANNGNDNENENDFAFISNGQLIILSEGTLQVIDALGRIVLCKDGSCTVSTDGMTPGVYVLRLINGEHVKTQKIVVR